MPRVGIMGPLSRGGLQRPCRTIPARIHLATGGTLISRDLISHLGEEM